VQGIAEGDDSVIAFSDRPLPKVIAFTSAVRHQFRKLPDELQLGLISVLRRHAGWRRGDLRKLSGEPGARLRLGDYRVVFVETVDEIAVRAVGRRRDVYR
jgi:mRNA interferase RelE/StbE